MAWARRGHRAHGGLGGEILFPPACAGCGVLVTAPGTVCGDMLDGPAVHRAALLRGAWERRSPTIWVRAPCRRRRSPIRRRFGGRGPLSSMTAFRGRWSTA